MLADARPSIEPFIATAAVPVTSSDPLESLARRAQTKDPAAVRELLDAVAPTVFRVVCGVLGRGHRDVDDVTQVALIEVLKGLRSFRGDSRVTYFASRIALRTAMRSRRRGHQSQEREQRWLTLNAEAAQDGSHPEELVLEKCRKLWQRLLKELPAAQAETLMFKVILDYSLDETADATGAGFNTVRSRLRMGIENLRRRIQEDPSFVKMLEEP